MPLTQDRIFVLSCCLSWEDVLDFRKCCQLSCHAIQRLATIISTRHALHFQGTSGGGFTGRAAEESRRRRVQASRSMAANPPDPH
eukprot:1138029-Pelagomonas_calceolata.AAC.1